MDVSCPRCHSEYEFDEARVPDDGITVKCAECAHVFRVQRPSGETALPPPPTPREWKIRRRSTGTTSACRELTALQQWIVEGKVTRDDEISLTGETWKRLGDIPELASFFQVVDDAVKARAYEAVRTASQGVSIGPSPASSPVRLSGSTPGITETWREPNFKAPSSPTAGGGFPLPPQGPTEPLSQELRSARRKPLPSSDDDELDRAIKGSGSRWPYMMVVGIALGVGAGWYFGIFLPEQEAKAVAERERSAAAQEAELKKAAAAPVAAMTPPVVTVDAGPSVAPEQTAVTPVPDSGAKVNETVDAGPSAIGAADPAATKKANRADFNALQAQGERLLGSDKPEAALSAFGRAADLRPDRVEPVVGKGLALLDMSQASAAQAAFEQALTLNARYGPAIMGLAEAMRIQGKNERAVEWYQRYLEVMPDGTEANVARNNIERLKK